MSKAADFDRQQCLTPPENAAIIAALFDAEAKEKKQARQVIWLQIAATVIAAGIAYSMKDTPQYAVAVLGGGGVSVINSVLLAWRMTRKAVYPAPVANHSRDALQQLRLMYFYAAERFMVVLVLLALCMAVLKLLPLAVLSGFVTGQAVLIAARLFMSRFKTEIVTKNG